MWEPGFLQCFDRAQIIYARKLRHSSSRGYFHLANLTSRIRFAINFQIFPDCVPDVLKRLVDICALRMTARQFRTAHRNTLIVLNQGDMKFSFHASNRKCGAETSTQRELLPTH